MSRMTLDELIDKLESEYDHNMHCGSELVMYLKELRDARLKGDTLRAERNSKSSEIGNLMKEKKVDEANAIKAEVSKINDELLNVEKAEEENKDFKDKIKSLLDGEYKENEEFKSFANKIGVILDNGSEQVVD